MMYVNGADQVQVRRTCHGCNGTGVIVADANATEAGIGKEPVSDDHPEGSQRPCDRCNGDKFEYRWVPLRNVYTFINEETARQARARSPRPF